MDISIYTIKKDCDETQDKEKVTLIFIIKKVHYVYVCRKKDDACSKMENFSKVYFELEKQEMEELISDEEQELGPDYENDDNQ